MLEITLEYTLSKMDEAVIDRIIEKELGKKEKIEMIMKVDRNRLKSILLKIGIKEQFLKTI